MRNISMYSYVGVNMYLEYVEHILNNMLDIIRIKLSIWFHFPITNFKVLFPQFYMYINYVMVAQEENLFFTVILRTMLI